MRAGAGVKSPVFRENVIKFIRQCQGKQATDIALPAFFVDSLQWNSEGHPETRVELERLREFIRSRDPLPTEAVVTPSVDYLKIELEYDELSEIEVIPLSHNADDDEWDDQEQVKRYQRRRRAKQTAFDGETISYSDWTVTRTWEERKRSHIVKQRVTLTSTVAEGEKQETWERVRRTDFDGVTVRYHDWRTIELSLR
jgi:hypothetical protein